MKKLSFLIFLILSLLYSNSILAAEYHVTTTGNDSAGDGSLQNPWRHPEYAAKQLKGNDTLYIHAGTYLVEPTNVPGTVARYAPMISPPTGLNNDATSPILITNYENDAVFLDGTTTPPYPVIGSGLHTNYVTVDGFKIRGAVTFMWVDYCTIKNSDIFGGIDCPTSNGGDNFGCVVRVEGGTGILIQNNKLHDNQKGITIENSPLIMEYSSTDLTIENNDIYNSISIGIRLKDQPNNVHIRYNNIYSNYFSGVQGSNQVQGYNVKIYHNIFNRNNTANDESYGALRTNILISGWKIYNNTFIHNNYAAIRNTSGSGIDNIQSWNNIFLSTNSFYRLGWSSSGPTFSDEWTYSDYNNFTGGGNWQEGAKVWGTLASFQTGNEKGFDAHSNTNNPNFINPEGFAPEDYKRTSYPTDGRGGSYALVMGAFITGEETIGYSSPLPSKALSPPADFQSM